MTRQERTLRAIVIGLLIALLGTLGVGGVVAYRYIQVRDALTKCYGVADAGVFFILGAQSEHEGSLETAKAQRDGGNAALAKLGEDDIVEAMERCDHAFWVGP